MRISDWSSDVCSSDLHTSVCAQRKIDEPLSRIAIVGMGRYGGFELSYGSDADVMFVHAPLEGVEPQKAATYAQAVANELRRMLALPASDPPLEVDADLTRTRVLVGKRW